jgi:ABC-type transport system involved in multi-copper enzyme maturation permease subunit
MVSDRFDTVRQFGLDFHAARLLGMNSGSERVTASQAWVSVGVLVLYTAAFVIVSYMVFNRRDVASS